MLEIAPLPHRGLLLGLTVVLPLCLLLVLPGCETRKRPVSDLRVVAVSVPPLGYMVERLAGSLVQVEVLIPPGASLHSAEPRANQMRAIGRAVMYVKVGHPHLRFESTWLSRLVSDDGGLVVVSTLEAGPPLLDDPHVWVSPAAVRLMVPRLAAALTGLLPDARLQIEENLHRFLQEIDALDAQIRADLADLPMRRFYVFHPAWGYFARDYGLQQVPIEAGEKEPDPVQLARLVATARAEHVRVIFVQPQFSRRSAEVVAGEIGADVVSLDPLAYDWPANLRYVTTRFVEALGS